MFPQNPLKIGLGMMGAGLFGVLFGWVLFPFLLKHQLTKEMALSKKTEVRELWEKLPFPLELKVYLFNYTNVEEIQKGAIPIVKEIGPYHFDEWKEKVDVEDHEEDDTITYRKKDVFLYNPDKSAPGLTGEEIIVMPHVIMLSIATVVNRTKPAMMDMVGKAFKSLFNEPKDIFMRVKAMDFMFRGIMIDCAKTEFGPKAICTALKKEAPTAMTFESNNQYRFSVFGVRNGSIDPHVVTVRRGINDIMDVGRMVAVDGRPGLDIWKDECNLYLGTDGTVFPPFLKEEDYLESYFSEVCRSFKPWYHKKTKYHGIKTNRYIVDIGDFASDPELQCFCDTPDTCPPRGVMDLMKCKRAPTYATLPHFLGCDEYIKKGVIGFSPDVDKHGMYIDFEPISGTPMIGLQRVQFNMILLKSDKLEIAKELPNTMVPLLWVEEGVVLNKTYVNQLKHQLFIPKTIVNVVRWLHVVVGILGLCVTIASQVFKDKMPFPMKPSSVTVSNVNPEMNHQTQQPSHAVSIIGEPQGHQGRQGRQDHQVHQGHQAPPKVDM